MFISQKEKIFFAEHLSLLIKGGIPISEAIETLKDETKSPVLKKSPGRCFKKNSRGSEIKQEFSILSSNFQ